MAEEERELAKIKHLTHTYKPVFYHFPYRVAIIFPLVSPNPLSSFPVPFWFSIVTSYESFTILREQKVFAMTVSQIYHLSHYTFFLFYDISPCCACKIFSYKSVS